MKKKPLPQIPKVLKDELTAAIDQAINEFGVDNLDELLLRRAKLSPMQKYICEYGISGKASIDSLNMLERTLEKFRAYRNDGAADYISSSVESHLAKIRSQERNRKRNDFGSGYVELADRNKRIIESAKNADYESSSDKASIVSRISNQLTANGEALGESQIRRILSDAGMTRKKKTGP